MRGSVYILLFIFSTSFYTAKAQKKYKEMIQWEADVLISDSDSNFWVSGFENAFYNLEKHNFPVYRKKIELPLNIADVEVSVEPLTYYRGAVSNDTQQLTIDALSWALMYDRKVPYLLIDYIPIDNGRKVEWFDIEVSLSYRDVQTELSLFEENSKLSEGDWYKLKVSESGLYKIDYQLLEDLEISPSSIQPENIQIYGNGGGMLPEPNSSFRYDDLVENPIWVHGQDDGSFDANDFILFYAESAHDWVWDEGSQMFNHILNIYDDENYYYLYIGDDLGKRVADVENTLAENQTIDFYTDMRFYEWENENLIHSGRQWFGEYFSHGQNYDINFGFSDRITEKPVLIKARGVANSTSSSNIIVKHNSAQVLNVSIPALSSSSDNIVTDGEETGSFISQDNFIDLSLSYNKNGNSVAYAYLDYIEVQTECLIKYNGGVLSFREPASVGQGNLTRFNLTTNKSDYKLWDVTNPHDIHSLLVEDDHSFVVATDSLREFVVHDLNSSSYRQPTIVKKLDNQNLHSHQPVEYIIITPEAFLEPANRLAEIHRSHNQTDVRVVQVEHIYNEFSSGRVDLVAIRDYLRMLYSRAEQPEDMVENVLLFGDASFDYKGIGVQNNRYSHQSLIPTYQSYSSFKIGPSYCTDDFLAVLDEEEGNGNVSSFDGLDVGIGRIVCQTATQADEVVSKIEAYLSHESIGDWRTNICFVADDVDEDWEFRLQENVDGIASRIDTQFHNYNVNKIYIDSYQQVSSAGGERYPDARKAIVETVNDGVLMLHYYGHGGEVGWAEERILELIDINSWENINKLAVFITATCEFSRYDDSKRISAGEQVLMNPNGAGVALFTTTRTITETDAKSLSSAFYDYAIPELHGENLTFGQIMRQLKNDLPNDNKKKFTLLGDPALCFPIPKTQVVLKEIIDLDTQQQVDSISALSRVLVRAEIVNDGVLDTSFSGLVKTEVYDKPSKLQTLNNDNDELSPFEYELQQSLLYSGRSTVDSGRFEFEFVVPKDIAIYEDYGKMSFYAYTDTNDAIGADVDFVIGGYNVDALEDNNGPNVELFMNSTDFRSGGITNTSPLLYALVEDESGINTTGNGIGHDIVAVLDQNTSESIVLNHFYESSLDSYQSGEVKYPFVDLDEGVHNLSIKVWDVYNNSSTAETEFLVVSDEGLILENLMNYPNPFRDYTKIYFEHNYSGKELLVRLSIYDMSGNKVWEAEQSIQEESYSNSHFQWDGLSHNGSSLSSGLYLCNVHVNVADSDEEKSISSQIVLIK